MSAPRLAILFKTHFWDDFARRQFRRYPDAAPAAQLAVCLDEENGPLGEVEAPIVVRARHADFLAIGLSPRCERGNLLWWNTDYFHYLVADRHPDFDYLLAVEYDTCCLGDLEAFVASAAAQDADMVGLPIRTPLSQWMWTRFHVRTYRREELRGSLNCISLFSRRAVDMLGQRRRAMARETVPFWPGNEVFLPTEIARAGMRFLPLQAFGDVSRYEWHPPVLEEDLPASGSGLAFIHPVLDRRRYIASQLRFASGLLDYVLPSSALRRDLARFPEAEWRPLLRRAAVSRLRMRARERAEGIAARMQLALEAS